eukprot:TRINITY_DN688_c0_g2_i1.p1 TRINITY_DN688_c0_g2~~TRINITY_DN688_c0_g2_i1.p1  ORF type:complete len:212 (+),score=81.16 TRINITY_DN688_c0_g2_i1:116-751(+)
MDYFGSRMPEPSRKKKATTGYTSLKKRIVVPNISLTTNYAEVFRTWLVLFGGDDQIAIEDIVVHVAELFKGGADEQDKEMYARFQNSFRKCIVEYSKDKKHLTEEEFCAMMNDINKGYTPEKLGKIHGKFMIQLFRRVDTDYTGTITVPQFKQLLERGKFKFKEGEFELLKETYFKDKEQITQDDFVYFSSGLLPKQTTVGIGAKPKLQLD